MKAICLHLIRHRFIKFLLIVLFCFVSYKGYEWYRYGDFKRAYEHGTVYEQLDTLMNGTRYVEAVRKAGYVIDDYNLMMTERIASLTTKGEPTLEVESPTEVGITVRYRHHVKDIPIRATQKYNKKMSLKDIGVYHSLNSDGSDKERIELSTKEEKELASQVLREIKWMLKDIYESMYPKEGK